MQRKRLQSYSTITSLIMKNKKKRSENFSRSEVLILIDIVEKYRITVENKKTNAAAWAEKKNAWENITEEFNAISANPPRTWKTLKLKYEGIKKEIRRKQILMREHQRKNPNADTGLELHNYEERVLSIMQLDVSGYNSGYDVDECEQPSKDGDESMGFIKIEDLDKGNLEFTNSINNETITGEETPSTSKDGSIHIIKVEQRDDEIPDLVPPDNIGGVVGSRTDHNNIGPVKTIPIRKLGRKRHLDQFSDDIQMQRIMILKKKILLLQESLLKDEIESKRKSRTIEQEILQTNLETAKIELKIKQKMLEQMER